MFICLIKNKIVIVQTVKVLIFYRKQLEIEALYYESVTL